MDAHAFCFYSIFFLLPTSLVYGSYFSWSSTYAYSETKEEEDRQTVAETCTETERGSKRVPRQAIGLSGDRSFIVDGHRSVNSRMTVEDRQSNGFATQRSTALMESVRLIAAVILSLSVSVFFPSLSVCLCLFSPMSVLLYVSYASAPSSCVRLLFLCRVPFSLAHPIHPSIHPLIR